jgi:hypothetical protein
MKKLDWHFQKKEFYLMGKFKATGEDHYEENDSIALYISKSVPLI